MRHSPRTPAIPGGAEPTHPAPVVKATAGTEHAPMWSAAVLIPPGLEPMLAFLARPLGLAW